MASQKGNKSAKGSGSMDWSDPIRNRVDVGAGVPNKNESDIPTVIVICIAIMALVFVLIIPAMAIIYVDLNNATNAAIVEIKKMRELRAKLLMDIQGE